MDLDQIIRLAIPSEDCSEKNARAMHRRELLKKRLNEYIAEQLSKQSNARTENGHKPGVATS